jgi:hypothetical protein
MIVSSNPASFSARSLALLQSVGAWMTIAPEQTYVATSIRGLGACKSTYCKAERREPPALAAAFPNGRLAALFAVALAATGLLSGFAAHRQAEARDMAEPDQLGPGIADCQKSAASVSSGASAGDAGAATPSCGSAPAVAEAATVGTDSSTEIGLVNAADAIARASAAGRVGFAGG